MTPAQPRVVAVWPHATRADARVDVVTFVRALDQAGLCAVVPAEDCAELSELSGVALGAIDAASRYPSCELAVIFGGDGSILRAAEWALEREVPLLGVNLGHVGFLAELERSDLDQLLDHVVARDYTVEERLAVAVSVVDPEGRTVWSSTAVNEVSVEKFARERMLELLVAIDGRPLSRWGCDGVLVSTPTGSTAYAFSAGGPVIWPDVEAFLVVPLSAHALFSRPVVIGPDGTVDITLTAESRAQAVVWCDGRRSTALSEGMRVQVVRAPMPLKLARLREQNFTNRLVMKFDLPVDGWRHRDAGRNRT